MGQGQPKECADEKRTDNLSAKQPENDIKYWLGLAEEERSMAMSEKLNRWKMEQVKIAITGRGATGKSTFINTIRNVKPGDDGFAEAGSGDTTITPTLYKHPTNDQITFCDLPGYASTEFKKEDYISEMKIFDYDFFFIFFNNVLGEDDIWLVGELRKLGKPFALVRSKIDIDIDNAIHDGTDPEMIQQKIKGKIQKALNANPELKDTKGIFLISSRKPDLGEMSDLMTYVEENIDDVKAQAFLFSLGYISKEIMERKHKMLQKRLFLATALSAGVAVIPFRVAAIPVVGITVNAMLVYEVHHYMHVFGFKQEIINSLEDFNFSLLRCRAMLETNFNMLAFIRTRLEACDGQNNHCLLDWLLPFFESVQPILHSVTTAARTYTFLHGMLQDLKHDAVLIHEHIKETCENHRM